MKGKDLTIILIIVGIVSIFAYAYFSNQETEAAESAGASADTLNDTLSSFTPSGIVDSVSSFLGSLPGY
jgi:predicted negative regulator of RcsB-dependent stress response